jgi:hypothetical protein
MDRTPAISLRQQVDAPVEYAPLGVPQFSVELFEQLWAGHEDAPGLGVLWPEDVVELEADSDDGAEWIRKRKPPRTPTFNSRRGPHYLLRGNGGELNPHPADGVEVLSRDSGKRLLVLPPTPPKEYLPSLALGAVDLVRIPPAFCVRVSPGGKRPRIPVELGPDLPPREAHERMLSIVGRLANVLPLEELWVAATALNAGRLPGGELRAIVEDVAAKAGDAARYFDKSEGLLVPRLGNEIAEAFDIRVGAGRHLYWYRDGVFRDSGKEQIEKATRRALGDRYKRRHAEELVAWFRAEQQQIPNDPSGDLLNARNGMLDWRTGDLHAHSPEHLSITQIPVAWDPDATCPTVDEFLAQVLPDDAQRLAREIFGYALWPSGRMRRSVMLLGSGSNGKSTWLALARALLGPRNVSSVPLQAFGESRFATADVYGKLANLCGDLDARALRRSDTFKTLTGGSDAVRDERKYETAFYSCRSPR